MQEVGADGPRSSHLLISGCSIPLSACQRPSVGYTKCSRPCLTYLHTPGGAGRSLPTTPAGSSELDGADGAEDGHGDRIVFLPGEMSGPAPRLILRLAAALVADVNLGAFRKKWIGGAPLADPPMLAEWSPSGQLPCDLFRGNSNQILVPG